MWREHPGDQASGSGSDTISLHDLGQITASLDLSVPHLNPNMVKPRPLFKAQISDVSPGQNSEGTPGRATGRRNGLSQAPAGVSGESKLPSHSLPPPPTKPLGQLQVANKNLLAQTPLGRASLSQRALLRGSRPKGRESKGLLEEAGPHAPIHPPGLAERDRRAGSLPSHAEQKAAGARLCRPRPRCAVGVGVGRENLVPGEGKGPRSSPKERRGQDGILDREDPSPDSWRKQGLGCAWGWEGDRARLGRKGAPGPRRGGKCSGEVGRGCSKLKGRG